MLVNHGVPDYCGAQGQVPVSKLAAPRLKEPDQVRMRQFRGRLPSGELEFRVFRIRRDEFDRGLLKFPFRVLRQEHSAVFRATQVLAQVEFLVEDLTFPLFPGLGHIAPASRFT